MPLDIDRLSGIDRSSRTSRYCKQLERVRSNGKRSSTCIEAAVEGAVNNIKRGEKSFVIYGEPQSGKTEMMICLTAALLDDGYRWIVLLLNDSIDLLDQNLSRFQRASLSPTPVNYTELLDPDFRTRSDERVIFCKKNGRDLSKLIEIKGKTRELIVIDDEADFASPNSKVNKNEQSKINQLVETLIGTHGIYIGVTATPARLDLNNTFSVTPSAWVKFPPHENYRGQETFFPRALPSNLSDLGFILTPLPNTDDSPKYLRKALFSFFVSCAELNLTNDESENYCFLIHTSGKKADHSEDYKVVRDFLSCLSADRSSTKTVQYLNEIYEIAERRFPGRGQGIVEWIYERREMSHIVLMNSDSDKKVSDFSKATSPSFTFTIAIGGNIVSRGVTFDNLLGMFFTRDVKHKIQQDTYIQRARMFGSRGKYLHNFELTVPENLYDEWRRCFVFHRLSLESIQAGLGAPVWLEGARVATTASGSIDKANVNITRGEMGFAVFTYTPILEEIRSSSAPIVERLRSIQRLIGEEACPNFIIKLIEDLSPFGEDSATFFNTTEIEGFKERADPVSISRRDGGAVHGFTKNEREGRFKNVIHVVKFFTNRSGMARMYYKYYGGLSLLRNVKNARV